MSLYFSVKFEDSVGTDELYNGGTASSLDSEFKSEVVEELDEELSVVECRSDVESHSYAVFQASFDRTSEELYSEFGSSGMSQIIGDAAEYVYGCPVVQTSMEKRH